MPRLEAGENLLQTSGPFTPLSIWAYPEQAFSLDIRKESPCVCCLHGAKEAAAQKLYIILRLGRLLPVPKL